MGNFFSDDFYERFRCFGLVVVAVVFGKNVVLYEALCSFWTVELKFFNVLLQFEQNVKKFLLYEWMFRAGLIFTLGSYALQVVRSYTVVVLYQNSKVDFVPVVSRRKFWKWLDWVVCILVRTQFFYERTFYPKRFFKPWWTFMRGLLQNLWTGICLFVRSADKSRIFPDFFPQFHRGLFFFIWGCLRIFINIEFSLIPLSVSEVKLLSQHAFNFDLFAFFLDNIARVNLVLFVESWADWVAFRLFHSPHTFIHECGLRSLFLLW
jgi:hypothetical protein